MSEDDCRKHLLNIRWQGSPKCIHCEHNKLYYLSTRKTYKCANCKKQFSITQGTLFERSKLPLRKWFAALFLFTTEARGITSIQLAKHIKVEQKTAWLMLQKLRKTAGVVNEKVKLTGTVEVDEHHAGAKKNRDLRLAVKIDKRKRHRIRMEAEGVNEKREREKRQAAKKGKVSQKKKLTLSDIKYTLSNECRRILDDKEDRMRWYQPIHYRKNIVGMIERDIKDENGNLISAGKLVLAKMGRQRGDVCEVNMLPLLTDKIHSDAHVMTDEAKVYSNLSLLFKDHTTVNHKKRKYVDEGTSTNLIENVWNQFKKMEKGKYVHFSWKYTDNYLNEFVLRYNSRTMNNHEKFTELFNATILFSMTRLELFSISGYYCYMAK